MIKNLFYYLVKYLLYIYNFVYFRKVKIYGKVNIPTRGGVLYSPNHQGAFLDPLLIGTLTPGKVTSLTRSDVFGGPFQWFLDALEMLPVYRIRNGYSNLKKNDATFEQCYKILGQSGSLLMFSEGKQHNEYFLQNLSKGSSRLAYQAQKYNPKTPVYMMPVGINYGHHQRARCTLHLVLGSPILVRDFIIDDQTEAENINALKQELQQRMKDCLWIPENDETYASKKMRIHAHSTRKGFHELKKNLHEGLDHIKPKKEKSKTVLLLAFLLGLPNVLPLYLTQKTLRLFKDIVFYSSMKYVFGVLVFPLWWLLTGLLLNSIFGSGIAITFVVIAIVSIFIRSRLLLV